MYTLLHTLHVTYVARKSRVIKIKIDYGNISRDFMRNKKWSNATSVAKN